MAAPLNRPVTPQRRAGREARVPYRSPFPRKAQNVVLVLPVASADGMYLLKFLDTVLKPRLSSSAGAALANGDASIMKELDLTALPAGRYTLAIKREPEQWPNGMVHSALEPLFLLASG